MIPEFVVLIVYKSSINQLMKSVVVPILYLYMVDLHKFYSPYITFILVNNIIIGTTCLSRWLISEIRLYDMMFAPMISCSWVYLKNILQSSSLICHILTKAIWCSSWTSYTYMLLVIALSFVNFLWPLWEFVSCSHHQDSCAHHCFPCYTSAVEVSIVPPIYSMNKTLDRMC
jgi:hypothetical protein